MTPCEDQVRLVTNIETLPRAIGSDTGGSVRLPASSYRHTPDSSLRMGLSRHGLVAYASSLDTDPA